MVTSNDRLQEYLDLELTKRAKTGAIGSLYLFAVSFIYAYSQVHLLFFDYTVAILMCLVTVARIMAASRAQEKINSESASSPKAIRLYSVVVLITGLLWSAWVMGFDYRLESTHPVMSLVFIIVAGLVSASTLSLGSSPKLFNAYTTSIFLWLFGLLAFHPGAYSIALILISISFVAFVHKINSAIFLSLRQQLNMAFVSESKLEMIKNVLDTLPGLVSVLDKDLKYRFVSKSLTYAYKMKESAFIGQPLGFGKTNPDLQKIVTEFFQSPLHTVEKLMPFQLADGKKWHQVYMTKLALTDSIVIFSVNVHEKMMLEKQSQNDRALLIHSAKLASLGEMAGGIAHEINNPLSVIVAKASQLIRKTEPLETFDENIKKEYLAAFEKILTTCHRMTAIVQGMRELSGQRQGESEVAASFDEIFQEVLILSAQKLKASGVELRVHKNFSGTALVKRVGLSQVLLNLINNAYDAIRHSPRPWIDITCSATQDRVKIVVTDSGTGIPAEIREKIMQPFFTTKDPGKGTGLGLSISKGLLESMNGTIEIDPNAPNTSFVISVKRAA